MSNNDYEGLSEDTKRLLSGRETTEVDFKQSQAGIDSEDYVALANAKGGVILLGVSNKKEIIGCKGDDDQLRLSLHSKANKCRPSIEIIITEEVTLSGKRVYRIDVLESTNKPCCTEGGTYKIRQDGNNKGIFPEELKQMFLQRSGLPKTVANLEHELQQTKRDAQDLAKSIPTEDQIGYTIAKKIRGF